MSQTFRHPDILEIARREGKVVVEDLAERFGVTVQTIRRDLTELADAGKLERVHGDCVRDRQLAQEHPTALGAGSAVVFSYRSEELTAMRGSAKTSL